jgi:hemoglobin
MKAFRQFRKYIFPMFLLAAAYVGDGARSQARAQDKKAAPTITRQDLDDQISELARQAINAGADIYNGDTPQKSPPNPTKCVDHFQGSLTVLRGMLDHKPDLQKQIDRDVAAALAKKTAVNQAWALRAALVNIRSGLARMDPIGPGPDGKTLWERLGGEKGVTEIVDYFLDQAMHDQKVDFFRAGKIKMTDEQIKHMKRQFVCLASTITKGPLNYVPKASMSQIHDGMSITGEQFDQFKLYLSLALYRNKVASADQNTVLELIENTRPLIVKAQAKAPPPLAGPAAPPPETLWERLGGKKAVTKIVDELIEAAVKDKNVNFSRDGKFPMTPERVAKIKEQFVVLASSITGGNLPPYKGPTLDEIHKGMGITNAEFDAFKGHVRDSMLNNSARQTNVNTVLLAMEAIRNKVVAEKPDAPPAAVPVAPKDDPPRVDAQPKGQRTAEEAKDEGFREVLQGIRAIFAVFRRQP